MEELIDVGFFQVQAIDSNNWYDQMLAFITKCLFLEKMSKDKRKKLAFKSKSFINIASMLYKKGIDQVIRRCVPNFEQIIILKKAHQGIAGGHF